MDWIAKLSSGPVVVLKKNNISECTKHYAPKPLKPTDQTRANLATVESNLKPCSLCNKCDFIHGNQGGYFCTNCQPGHEGEPVLAGGKRSVTDLKGDDLGLSLPEDNHSAPARIPRGKTSSSFNTAHKWILQHRFELLGAGWRPSELYRRNNSRGIAWL
jgi:hypothetical protein